jgi:hypothetical protein
MEQTVIDLLVNGSPMAGFAAFLLWNFWANRKQISDLSDRQFELYKQLTKEKDEAEDKVRERYNKVILDLQTRDQALRTSLEQRLDRVEAKLATISDRIQKLELRELARSAIPSPIGPTQ